MSKPSSSFDPLAARLLSGKDEPSVIEREVLWNRIEASLEPTPKRANAWLKKALFIAAPALAAAAILIVFLPPDEFRARGKQNASAQVRCLNNNALSPCTPASTLTFLARAKETHPYLAAFVEYSAPGKITWLVRESILLDTAQDYQSSGFNLDAELNTQDAFLYVVFSKHALDNDALKQALEQNPQTLIVVKRPLLQDSQ